MKIRVMGLQKPGHGGIVQELSDIGPGQGQIQHIFPVTDFNGLYIACKVYECSIPFTRSIPPASDDGFGWPRP
jgi:hypothetical protein